MQAVRNNSMGIEADKANIETLKIRKAMNLCQPSPTKTWILNQLPVKKPVEIKPNRI